MNAQAPQALFHLAFPVNDIAAARNFYAGLLGCPEGRSAPDWVDCDFYGHQIVAHLSPGECAHCNNSAVDGEDVPVRHVGAILPMADWEHLAAKLNAADTQFVIEPQVRFKGRVGEQATMFFPRPGRQRGGVQGLRRHGSALRKMSIGVGVGVGVGAGVGVAGGPMAYARNRRTHH